MKSVRHGIGKLALTLALAVTALLLPSSSAHARQGHGGGHAGWGGSGFSTHHAHHPNSGGYGGIWGGYYPYGGYDSFYGGYYGYGGYGAGMTIDPYLGAYTNPWGVYPVTPYGTYQSMNFMDIFR
jgi:hypothetical protein